MPKTSRIHTTREDKRLYIFTNIIITLFFLVVLIPLVHVVAASFSSGDAILAGKVLLWPVEFSLEGFKTVFKYKEVFTSFRNSVVYSITGTFINVFLTMITAYALARRSLPFRGIIMFLFTFTMFFSGGMIPSYLQIKRLNIIDSMWALILPGAISAYNMIIARTFISTNIPDEMLEASQIDGCSDIRFFLTMVMPLSKAIVAVLCVYYLVGHWNSWYNAFLYIYDRDKYPLQLVLREILITNTFDSDRMMDPELLEKMQGLADVLKYVLIVISSLPMMMLYPFAQKFFIQGVMIGSVKG